jgi:hypothetical protein
MRTSDGSLVRAIRGPVTLITVGALFALNNFTRYSFDQTWPVILIVFGLLSLLRRGTECPRSATVGGAAMPTGASPSAAPPWYDNRPGAGYRESRYQQPPPENAGTAKGGFGTSAPPRNPADAGGNPPGGGTA